MLGNLNISYGSIKLCKGAISLELSVSEKALTSSGLSFKYVAAKLNSGFPRHEEFNMFILVWNATIPLEPLKWQPKGLRLKIISLSSDYSSYASYLELDRRTFQTRAIWQYLETFILHEKLLMVMKLLPLPKTHEVDLFNWHWNMSFSNASFHFCHPRIRIVANEEGNEKVKEKNKISTEKNHFGFKLFEYSKGMKVLKNLNNENNFVLIGRKHLIWNLYHLQQMTGVGRYRSQLSTPKR